MRVAMGGSPYAIGQMSRGRFCVRAIRFGKLGASYERRPDEEIRAVELRVAIKKSKPCKIEAE